MITIPSLVLGALFRRYFGGWIEWPQPSLAKHYFKIALGYVVAFPIAWYATQSLWAGLAVSAIIATGWWAVPYHVWGTWMGDTEKDGTKHPIGLCIAVLAAQYGIVSLDAAFAWYMLAPSMAAAVYAFAGFFAWVPYLAAKWVWKLLKLKDGDPQGGSFVVHYTNLGELGLGALMIGGLALARAVG